MCDINKTNHFCKPLANIFEKLELPKYTGKTPQREDFHTQRNMKLSEIFDHAENMLRSQNVLYKRFGCALLFAFEYLFRTTKGELDSTKTQSVWTLQGSHLTIKNETLTIKCE